MRALYRSVAAAAAALQLCAISTFATISTVSPASASGDMVSFSSGIPAGTIVVRTNERRLYLSLGGGRALAYPVGVGRAGMQWAGRSFIDGKYVRPDWAPPPDLRRPGMKDVYRAGDPGNPMGVAAMTLNGGGYAIHGTNNPGSIGGFVSHGCIRMYNQDIVDLYDRVGVGTPVIVTR